MMSKEAIEIQLNDFAKTYAALRDQPFSEEERKAVVRKAIVTVFGKYCPLIWRKEQIKNAGLEISETIEYVFSSFNPDKGCFINFLNSALSHAIDKGCKNAVRGSENNYKIQKDSSSKDGFDRPILDSLEDAATRPQDIPASKIESFLHELNKCFLNENKRHQPFLSEWLTWKTMEELDVRQYKPVLNQLDFYNNTFAKEQLRNEELNQEFIATRNSIKKDNASHIIKRFVAKISPNYKEYLQ